MARARVTRKEAWVNEEMCVRYTPLPPGVQPIRASRSRLNFRLRRSHFVDNFVTSDQCANLTPAPFAWPIMAAEGRRTCALQRGLAWEWRGAADLDSDLLVGA